MAKMIDRYNDRLLNKQRERDQNPLFYDVLSERAEYRHMERERQLEQERILRYEEQRRLEQIKAAEVAARQLQEQQVRELEFQMRAHERKLKEELEVASALENVAGFGMF